MFDRVVMPLDGPQDAVVGALSRILGREPEIVGVELEGSTAGFAAGRVLRRRGDPARAILDAVHSVDASLVAMPARETGLLRDCPVPVLTLRPDTAAREIREILLPVDPSLDWKAAAVAATEIARRHEAQVIVLRACAPEGRDAAERSAHEICGELVAAGAVAYAFVEEGPLAPAILEAAAAHEADLIVMTEGEREEPRGSGAADEVLRNARVPLLSVPEAMAKAWTPPPRELVED